MSNYQYKRNTLKVIPHNKDGLLFPGRTEGNLIKLEILHKFQRTFILKPFGHSSDLTDLMLRCNILILNVNNSRERKLSLSED